MKKSEDITTTDYIAGLIATRRMIDREIDRLIELKNISLGVPPGAYDTCAKCGKFYYTHEHDDYRTKKKNRHAFVRRDK